MAGCEYIYRETLFDEQLEPVEKDLWTNNFVDRLSGHGPLESNGHENFPNSVFVTGDQAFMWED